MAYLVGTDEAGYGPNLGPLVIATTVWHVPDRMRRKDLYDVLKTVVCAAPGANEADRRVAIADSKVLYQAGNGLACLERGVLTALAAAGHRPGPCRDTWDWLDVDAPKHREVLPWPFDFDGQLPLEADPTDLAEAAAAFAAALAKAKVRLCAIRATAIFPERFNALTEEFQTKGEALSRLTLGLVGDVVERLDEQPIIVLCDKHGGRNRYGRLLQQQFPDTLVEVREEGPCKSVYQFGPPERRLEVQFRVACESFLPTALASMVAKYLRELSMRAFNEFWRQRVPELRPTAGYPGDSRRFKTDIAQAQAALKIDDRVLWRAR